MFSLSLPHLKVLSSLSLANCLPLFFISLSAVNFPEAIWRIWALIIANYYWFQFRFTLYIITYVRHIFQVVANTEFFNFKGICSLLLGSVRQIEWGNVFNKAARRPTWEYSIKIRVYFCQGIYAVQYDFWPSCHRTLQWYSISLFKRPCGKVCLGHVHVSSMGQINHAYLIRAKSLEEINSLCDWEWFVCIVAPCQFV